jgi:hypothetical protein
MTIDPEFLEVTRFNAIHKWKWRRPWLSGLLAFIHPLGMFYSSALAAWLYLGLWTWMYFGWRDRPLGVGLLLAGAFAIYAYFNTRWMNAAIEHWKYGLPGTGTQNPKGMTPISEEQLERSA